LSSDSDRTLARAPWGLAFIAAASIAFAAGAQEPHAAAESQAPGGPVQRVPPDGGVVDPEEAARISQGPSREPPISEQSVEALEAALTDAEAAALASEAFASMDGGTAPAAEVKEVPAAAANAAAQTAPLPGLSLIHKARLTAAGTADEAFTAVMEDGRTARLTIHPRLQQQMEKLLRNYRPMGAAMVALDPKTGKVLALAEFAQDGKPEGLATRPLYPAASVFKIITGAALLEKGVSPDAETCYHGGLHGIVGKLLTDTRLDRRCLSLSMALAKSANVVFAKMAMKHLDANELRREAERFLFNRPIWEDKSVEQSTASIPDEKLAFAKSAAGFGQVKLSPLHAALIAAAVANGGISQNPTLIESIDGDPPFSTEPRKLLQKATADALREMMKLTITQGTASMYFRERRRSALGDIAVAGKTGSLSNHERPFKDYSWFVGFAPADDPQIAVAVVVVNGLKWRIHAPYVAREALRAYLVGGRIGDPPVAKRAPRRRKHR
jgi:membrane peptidoglycan carboxypeptidase